MLQQDPEGSTPEDLDEAFKELKEDQFQETCSWPCCECTERCLRKEDTE